MNKRGINPLIATTLLVGMTFVIGIVVMGFGHNLLYSAQQEQGENLQNVGLVNYDAYYRDEVCDETQTEDCYRMLFSSNEDSALKFNVITHAEGGIYFSESDEYFLEPFEQKIFTIYFPKELGDAEYAEVNAFSGK